MNSSIKINLILKNINTNINKLNLKDIQNEKLNFVRYVLDDIKDLLEFIIKDKNINKEEINQLMDIVDYQMIRLFEVSGVEKNQFKAYLDKHN